MALVVAEYAVDSLVPAAFPNQPKRTRRNTEKATRRRTAGCAGWVYVFLFSGDGCFLRAAPEAGCRWPGAPWLSPRWWRGSALVFSSSAQTKLTTEDTEEHREKSEVGNHY